MQQAVIEERAAQCGLCTNGMVIAAVSLLRQNPTPSEAQIRQGLERNLCRCGSHTRLIKAVTRASRQVQS